MKEEKNKKEYELSFWLKEGAPLNKVESMLNTTGVKITYNSEAKRSRLSYPIKKETEGYFGFIHFNGDEQDTKLIAHELKVDPEVLRFLISKNPIKKSEPRDIRRQIPEAKFIQKIEEKPSDLVTNEELERKLEEILK